MAFKRKLEFKLPLWLSRVFSLCYMITFSCKCEGKSSLDHLDEVNSFSQTHKSISNLDDDVIKWKNFPRCWPFVRGIHQSPVNSPHKGQWRGALMFSSICAWINSWVNNREAGDLRRPLWHHCNGMSAWFAVNEIKPRLQKYKNMVTSFTSRIPRSLVSWLVESLGTDNITTTK